MGEATVMFDPADPAFIADPYPYFAELRAAGEVHWHPQLGQYVAVSHAACDAVLRQRGLGRIWRDREPAEQFPAFNLLHRTSILESEPPTHTRLRRQVAGAFGRGHVERLRPWIAELADTLVADLAARLAEAEVAADQGEAADDGVSQVGIADLLAVVAEPLPVEVIAQLLNVPTPDRKLLRPWSNAIVKMYEYGLDPALQRAAETAAREFVDYLRDLIGRRRSQPLDADLVSDLVASDLERDEIVGTCVLLLMAGHEATVNVIGNGVLALLRRPQQWQRLVTDPGLVPAAAEEMIRFDSSLQLFERTALVDVEVAGTTIPAGSKVAALLGAANRDPAVFRSPDEFDAGREPNQHLGFGAGIHFCLGAPLARIEIQATLSALTRQLPQLTLAAEPVRRPEFVIRGLRALPVTRSR